MANILLVHEDGMLRGQHRKLLEQHGHRVSEISCLADQDLLPHDVIFSTIITQLEPLHDDRGLNQLPFTLELNDGTNPTH